MAQGEMSEPETREDDILIEGERSDQQGILESECVEQGVHEVFGKWISTESSNPGRIRRAS